jgi:hypothetical protein
MGPYKTKKLMHNKKMVPKLKRPPTGWEKMFANYTSEKGLKNRAYWELKN